MLPVQIPLRADDPLHILMWSADEIVPIIAGLTIGILVKSVFLFLLLGTVISKLYARFREYHSDGYLLHMAYHYGFGFPRSESMINPFIRRLIP